MLQKNLIKIKEADTPNYPPSIFPLSITVSVEGSSMLHLKYFSDHLAAEDGHVF